MDKNELKYRVEKVDDRTVALFKRYPLVGLAVFLAGCIAGAVLGAWVF